MPPQRKRRPHRLEVLIRVLIILGTTLSIVLSSIAVCDGSWLQTDSRTLGLWYFCSTEPGFDAVCEASVGPKVFGVVVGVAMCRAVVCSAVVAAIFSLELQVISQMSTGEDSARRWKLGSSLLLVAATASASGMFLFLFLFQEFVSLTSVTLVLWCQLTSAVFFFLNGLAALQVHRMKVPDPRLEEMQLVDGEGGESYSRSKW